MKRSDKRKPRLPSRPVYSGDGLDAEGIEVRAGKLAAEPLLKALGADEAVRASFMFYNTRDEADTLAAALEEISESAG